MCLHLRKSYFTDTCFPINSYNLLYNYTRFNTTRHIYRYFYRFLFGMPIKCTLFEARIILCGGRTCFGAGVKELLKLYHQPSRRPQSILEYGYEDECLENHVDVY